MFVTIYSKLGRLRLAYLMDMWIDRYVSVYTLNVLLPFIGDLDRSPILWMTPSKGSSPQFIAAL